MLLVRIDCREAGHSFFAELDVGRHGYELHVLEPVRGKAAVVVQAALSEYARNVQHAIEDPPPLETLVTLRVLHLADLEVGLRLVLVEAVIRSPVVDCVLQLVLVILGDLVQGKRSVDKVDHCCSPSL